MILMKIKKHILQDGSITYVLRKEEDFIKYVRLGYVATDKEEYKEDCEGIGRWIVSVAVKNDDGGISFYILYGKPDAVKILEATESEGCEMKLGIYRFKEGSTGDIFIKASREKFGKLLKKIQEIGGLE